MYYGGMRKYSDAIRAGEGRRFIRLGAGRGLGKRGGLNQQLLVPSFGRGARAHSFATSRRSSSAWTYCV